MVSVTERLTQAVSDATCGEACWEAREDVCRCSCDGKNHGVFRDTGNRPDRTSKIDRYVYRLVGVGEHGAMRTEASKVNKAAGLRKRVKVNEDLTYEYNWRETDKGAPARVKPASQSQAARWAELSAWKDLDDYDWYHNQPSLLWVRV